MCQLLGMSANVPTDMAFSLSGLLERGGRCGPHRDGWGVALYTGTAFRADSAFQLWREASAGSESTLAQALVREAVKARIGIAHVRQANVGGVELANTHPFVRDHAGRRWTFAHNGQLPTHPSVAGPFRAEGSTDSEAAFVALLNRLQRAGIGRLAEATGLVTAFAAEQAGRGVFNFLLSDGEHLLAFCSTKLAVLTRRAPFGVAQLADRDAVVDFRQYTTPRDVVTVLATEPLTRNEPWQRLQAGDWLLLKAGRIADLGRVRVPSHTPLAAAG